jgi:photosystem II stability/assembly factor-like uncharacterized protein
MQKRNLEGYLAIGIIFILVLSIIFLLKNPVFTGFAVFEQPGVAGEGDFVNGTYNNTEWNGSAVVLSSGQVTGTYTSKVFDCGSSVGASWNNLSYIAFTPQIEFLYGVDGSGSVYSSSDSGVTWTEKTSDYGRGSVTSDMCSDNSAVYIMTGTYHEFYKSTDAVSWDMINDSFSSRGLEKGGSNSLGEIFVTEGVAIVYKSSDSGQNWQEQGDANGASTWTPKGIDVDSSDNLFLVDGQGKIFMSNDSGQNWQEQGDYGGGSATDDFEIDSDDDLYILLNKEIYKSIDQGQNWSIINESFTPYSQTGLEMFIDNSDNFYILDKIGRVFSSDNSGVSWTEVGDINGGDSNDPKGLTGQIQNSNLSFQVRNCSSVDCSDGVWQDVDLKDINLVSRYFQYKIEFTSPDSSISPSLENISIGYEVLNTAPSLNLVKPQQGTTYGYNESLPLEYSVSDADNNLDSCWYNINGGSNIMLNSCQNTSFNVSSNGNYNLTIYANDTHGEQVESSARFSVQIGSPTIIINSPYDVYLAYYDIIFKYVPDDIDLDSCQLWGDFDGYFSLNQTNTNPSNGAENNFSLMLDDGIYRWNIKCNDSQGNSAFNGNKTFYIDTVNPDLIISEPSGAMSSRSDIPLTFSVSDASPVCCLYNIYWTTGEIVKSNTSIDNCANTEFDVSADGNYILNLYVNDSANNRNFSYSEFSVDTSIPGSPPPSSSGGGGGGISLPAPTVVNESKFSIAIIGLQDVVSRPGESKTLSLEVRNTGKLMQNNCKLTAKGNYSKWIFSEDEKDLNANEKAEFIFVLDVPKDVEIGDYSLPLVLKCQDGEKNVSLKIGIIKNNFQISIKEIQEIKRDEIIFSYILTEISGDNRNIEVNYAIMDYSGNKINEDNKIISLKPGESREFSSKLSVPLGTIGEYEFVLTGISDGISLSDKKSIVIAGKGVTGFAGFLSSGSGKTFISVGLLILAAGVFGFFIVRKIMRERKEKAEQRMGVIRLRQGNAEEFSE